MYVVMEGEITISFPDENIPSEEFHARYTEYTNLLKDMESKAEMERKKVLVAQRQEILEQLEQLKNNTSIESMDKLTGNAAMSKMNSVNDSVTA